MLVGVDGYVMDIPVVPVVYFYKGDVPIHQWYTACVSLSHGNPVVLICDRKHHTCHKPAYLKAMQIFYREDYLSKEYERFKRVFQTFGGTGIVDMERMLGARAVMKVNNISTAFYGDSDAAALTYVGMHRRSHCDAQIHLAAVENAEMKMFWVVWTGSGIVTLPLLNEFLEWSTELYTNSVYHYILEQKQREAPNLCDMSIWYLFVCANKGEITVNWNCPERLPRVNNTWVICDAQDDGFDSGRGIKKEHVTFLQQGVNMDTGTPIMYAYHQSKIAVHHVMFRLSSLHTHAKQNIPTLFPFCSEEQQRKIQHLS